MMRVFIVFGLLSFAISLSGQISNVYVTGQSLNDHFRIYSTDNSETKIFGSPYADEHWTVGTISFKNINQIVSDHLRLNAYSNELEVFNNGNKMAIIQPFNVKEVTVGNRKYIYAFYFYSYGKSEYISSSYFQVVTGGKIELLKRYYVTITNNSYVSNYMGGGGDGKNYYSVKTEYFYRIAGDDDDAARELSKKKKDLLRLMSDKQNEVLSFIKEKRIGIKSGEDIERVIEYYNSL